MTKNFDQSVEINHNKDWIYIPDHPYRILIISSEGSSRTNALLNLIKHQRTDIDKVYLYFKDSPIWNKVSIAFNGREKIEIKKLENLKLFEFLPNFHFTINETMRGYYL